MNLKRNLNNFFNRAAHLRAALFFMHRFCPTLYGIFIVHRTRRCDIIYYKIKCKYTVTEEADEAKLMRFWRKADSTYIGGKIYRLFILERDDTAFDALLMFSVSDHSLSSIKKRVINELDETGKTIKSMSKNKGFTIDGEAEEKCRRIFDEACKNAEFGNGRFVRNLLEQAIIKQSSRLVNEYGNSKIDKSIVSMLSADDFDINAAKVYKTEKIAIGF